MTDLEAPDIELRSLVKRFGDVIAVDDVDLGVGQGEFTALLGPSGCGKTTTLRMIAGFEEPTSGEVLIGGRDTAGVPPHKRNVNTVFQYYALFPHMTVLDNVAYGLKQRKVPKADRHRQAREALALVRMEGLERRRPAELSGGQQQRVALARALVMRPKVLLLDEPLGALDLKLRKEMQIELKRIQEEVGITFVIVTHDQEEAMALADRIAVMNLGRIEQLDEPKAIYDRPATPFVADFIGDMNHLDGVLQPDGTVDCGGGLHLRPGRTVARADARRRVRIGLRPEQVTASAEARREGEAGEVVTAMVVGHQLQLLVRLRNGAELLVRQQRSGDPALEHVQPGGEVRVSWPSDAPMLLGLADGTADHPPATAPAA